MKLWTVGKILAQLYGLVWMTAVGGIVGANLAATIGLMFFVTENKDVNVAPWVHTGWYAGTAFFFVGAILGKLRFTNGNDRKEVSTSPTVSTTATKGNESSKAVPSDKQSSAPSFILMCGFAGGFLGMLLGGSLAVFFFSYAYSPFALQEVASSVEIVEESVPTSGIRRPVFQSDQPLLLYLCLTPAVLGAILGVVGGVAVVLKYRERSSFE